MLEPSIAAKADYADAILVARRAKNWLFLILLVVLVGEIALFIVARTTSALGNMTAATLATTQPASSRLGDVLQYLVALAGFAGIAASLVLSGVLVLLVKIMLTGRTLGVAKVTSAFIWSLVLIVLLFPWQAILNGPTISAAPNPQALDFKLPGVIYTWTELTHPTLGAKFDSSRMEITVLRWARFIGFPAVAAIMLMSIQIKSSMGIKAALGEDPSVPAASNI
jgi:hypothetical protein